MRLSLSAIYIYFLLSACVSPYDVTTSFHPSIVVQGMITDQPGPYLVTISQTLAINDQLDEAPMVTGATVVIKDDEGNSETLTEKSSGNYYTSTFQGVVGRSYFITITTSDGSSYQSASEELLPVGDFSNLTYKFVQNEPAIANNQISSTNGFDIFIDSQVLPEQQGRVWWRWTGTFEIFTYPELQKKILPTNPPKEPPLLITDAPPCSGYSIARPNTQSATLVGPLANCECCTCWVTQYSQNPLISNPKFISNGAIKSYNVAFVEANRRTFYDQYYLEIEQLSVSETVYNFWNAVKIQQGNSSSLFQTPPPKTVGNITVNTPNSLPVIGYFAASASKKHSLVLLRSEVPYPLLTIDTLAMSCTVAYKNSSNVKPTFW
jgi:hypothetical protein